MLLYINIIDHPITDDHLMKNSVIQTLVGLGKKLIILTWSEIGIKLILFALSCLH